MTDEPKKEQELTWTFPAEVLPNNPRTDEIMKKRLEEEEIRRQKAEELRQLKEKEEKTRKLKERNDQAEKARREKAQREQQKKMADEAEQLNKLEGRMIILLDQLQSHKTPFEVSTTGLDLGPQRTAILAKNIRINKSLLSLHMSRKGIMDVDGQQLA